MDDRADYGETRVKAISRRTTSFPPLYTRAAAKCAGSSRPGSPIGRSGRDGADHLADLKAGRPSIHRAKMEATTEDDIGRHRREDGEPDGQPSRFEDVLPAGRVRDITGMTQAQFAEVLGVPLRTLQNWEQGRALDPAARSLLTVVARGTVASLDGPAAGSRAGVSCPLRAHAGVAITASRPRP